MRSLSINAEDKSEASEMTVCSVRKGGKRNVCFKRCCRRSTLLTETVLGQHATHDSTLVRLALRLTSLISWHQSDFEGGIRDNSILQKRCSETILEERCHSPIKHASHSKPHLIYSVLANSSSGLRLSITKRRICDEDKAARISFKRTRVQGDDFFASRLPQ